MYQSTMVGEPEAPTDGTTETDGYRITRKDGQIVIEGVGAMQGPRIPQPGDFDENLSELLDDQELTSIATRLTEYYRVDKDSRKDWELSEKRCLEMMGVAEIPAASKESPQLHKMVHPLLADAVEQFSSRAITEMFPDDGPVKSKVLGKSTADREAQAQRMEDFGNFYLTQVDEGYFNDTDQMLVYLPMAGSAFRKAGIDYTTGLPELRYVKASHFIAPYNGSTLKKMSRYCHEYTMLGQEIDQAVEIGTFRYVDLGEVPTDNSKNPDMDDQSDERVNSQHDDDNPYNLYEYHVNIGIDYRGNGQPKDEVNRVLPYVIIMESTSEKILMIRRNWKEQDSKRRKRVWFAHHKFLQGVGFYGWGYPHVIGSLLRATSGTVNSLLDAALMANLQGGFKTKESKVAGEISLSPGVWKDVDATFEELSKSFYTPPFKEPSAALVNLLAGLITAGQRFTATTEAAVGDADNRGPVGTTLALIEESQKIPSAIHKRLHVSMGQELKMLFELIADVMPNEYVYDEDEDQSKNILKSDFDGRVDIIPVTNPNISSNTQRIATAQLVMEVQANNPDLFPAAKRAAAITRLLQAAKVPDIDSIGPELPGQPQYRDPVSENALVYNKVGVRAFETQDHAAHIAIHKNGHDWAMSTITDPPALLQVLAGFDAHIREHEGMLYRQMVAQSAGIPMPPLGPDGLPQPLDPQTEAKLTAAVVNKLPPPPALPAAGAAPNTNGPDEQAITQAKIQQSKDMSAAKMTNTQNEYEQDQALKQSAHTEEMRRKDEANRAEIDRKNMLAATEIRRTGARARVEMATTQAKGATANQVAVQNAKNKPAAKTASKGKK